MALSFGPSVRSLAEGNDDSWPGVLRIIAMPLFVLICCVVCSPHEARGDAPQASDKIDVWLDVDTATGVGDVDDGLMLIQCFHSPELRIRGLSVVFGNTSLKQAVGIARDILDRFGPPNLEVLPGAAQAEQFHEPTPAVRGLAKALRDGPLTILAVGPVTNVAALLTQHPQLSSQIQRIVMVAARRPGQSFTGGEKQTVPHRDFNFELDPQAMRIILDTDIPLVFAPWEVSSKVWITRDDLAELSQSGAAGRWIADSSRYWIAMWEARITGKGFNPFDTLAAGFVTHPELIEAMRVSARIEELPDDRVQQVEGSTELRTKPYLLVEPTAELDREILYCHTPKPAFKRLLLDRLSGPLAETSQ